MPSRRALRVLLLSLVLGSGLLAVPAGAPTARAVGPLPDCRLDDIFTEPRDYDDWATTQVDWILSVGKGYAPPDLVSIYNAGVTGGGYVRAVAFDDLKAMADDARRAGVPLGSVSAYRSYKQQVALFRSYAGWNKTKGTFSNFDDAVTFSARPGHSEHQLGLVIDFAAAGSTTFVNETVGAGKWLSKNAWKYGWLMSYPNGLDKQVCYHYEPWHYRYVGRDLAKKIHDEGTTIREYLWANFTQVDVDCVALPPPKLVTPGKARSCAIAAANPSPEPSGAPASGPPSEPTSEPPSTPRPDQTSGPGGTAAPGRTADPTPAGVLGQAVPIGVALVAAVVLVLVVVAWQGARRRGGRAR